MYKIDDKVDDRYLIQWKLGEGAIGIVYKGFDERVEKDVALKILRDSLVESDEFRKIFKEEAYNLYELTNENICKFKDLSSKKDVIVLEYLDGQTLDYKIKTSHLSEEEIDKIFRQILNGLKHAHSKSIIHCDLKPSNIFLCKDNSVKILDFGISQTLRQIANSNNNNVRGTIEYMSPDLLVGKLPSIKSDLYSLGVILFKMFSNKLPYSNINKEELKKNIIKGKIDEIHPYNPKISSCYEKCINILLNNSSDKPFTSCEDIEKFLLKYSKFEKAENNIIGNIYDRINFSKYKLNTLIIAVAILLSTLILILNSSIFDSKPTSNITYKKAESIIQTRNSEEREKDNVQNENVKTEVPIKKEIKVKNKPPIITSNSTPNKDVSSKIIKKETELLQDIVYGNEMIFKISNNNVQSGDIQFTVDNDFQFVDNSTVVRKGSIGLAEIKGVSNTRVIRIYKINGILIQPKQVKYDENSSTYKVKNIRK